MGYFSDEALSFTAEDAELDCRDQRAEPLAPVRAIPVEWPAPHFAFGTEVYRREGSDDHPWQVVGLRWEDFGPLHSHPAQWCYRVARRYTRSGQTRVEQDPREYEQIDLSATPWCACAGLCFGVATTKLAGEHFCAECAADRQPF